ncbi:protein FANTASTIC FOUR 3-like [Vicia villosa]|uniref:protein FANTASTIC FOUR 3-like n=1 Tax=Vicia villosa TaxID=3911 RepID=UPI00273AD51D|nr:protein FANTASTIC FOUR 3-like [Vicia villosa]
MATIVCHGLPSTLDSHLVESRIHNLRLTSPKPITSQPIDLPLKTCFSESNTESNDDSWSSIQSLSKSNASHSQGLKESTYVHPNVKLPWQKLSSKSLELCTENLGNETGADILESSIDFFSLTSSSCDKLDTKEQKKSSCRNLGGEKVRTKNFPPPLKSMRGLESLRVKPHRENGRLVMELTKVPSSVSCFQAERSNGCLRLSFWNDEDEDDANDEEEEKEENTNEEEECIIDNENEVEEFIIDNEKDEREIYEVQTPTQSRESEEQKETYEVVTPIETHEIEEKEEIYEIQTPTQIRGVTRMEKYERKSRRRCKEIGKHENNEMMVNWGEPLWLALVTS